MDHDKVNVSLTLGDAGAATLIPRDDAAPCGAGADGWQYSPDQSKILLCGPACDLVKASLDARVEIAIGCKSVVK